MRLTVKQLRQLIRESVEEMYEDRGREPRASKYLRKRLPASWLAHLDDDDFQKRASEIDRMGLNASEHSSTSLWSYIDYVKGLVDGD